LLKVTMNTLFVINEQSVRNAGNQGIIRPVLAPVLVSVGMLLSAILLISLGLLYLLPVPGQVYAGSVVLLSFALVFVFLAVVWNDIYVRLTQSYEIGADYVRINVGFVTKQSQSVDRRNVASVTAMLPFPQRIFGLGHVKIATTDGNTSLMFNVRRPLDLVRMLEPPKAPAAAN
jgi:uncharacterized membrane protein YdbT with pleckstrin-like domain